MRKKKILFIGAASGLGDRIAIIPKLLDLKQQGYHISLLAYEPAYFTLFYNVDERFNIFKKSNLYDEILWVPRNKFKLILFILKNILKFDESYTPIRTFFSSLLGRLFSWKYSYSFKHVGDASNGKYNNIVEGTLNRKVDGLFAYKQSIELEYTDKYKKEFGLQTKKFMTLFVSLLCRCIPIEELEKIIKHINKKGYAVVLVGGDREKRIFDYIDVSKYDIVDTLGKTNFMEIASILSDSILNISMDGGLMRLGHLMNKNNISIQNMTFFLMQPPVDNIHSFNVRKYTYPACVPCNYFGSPEKGLKHRIKRCVFYGTDREGECRFAVKAEYILLLINKILNT